MRKDSSAKKPLVRTYSSESLIGRGERDPGLDASTFSGMRFDFETTVDGAKAFAHAVESYAGASGGTGRIKAAAMVNDGEVKQSVLKLKVYFGGVHSTVPPDVAEGFLGYAKQAQ